MSRRADSPVSVEAHPAFASNDRVQGLNSKWILELLRKRKSNYSAVLLLESADPTRWDQIREHLLHHADFSKSALYLFDSWSGLTRWDEKIQRFAKVRRQGAPSGYEATIKTENPLVELPEVLEYMDPLLKEGPTNLILQWMDTPHEGHCEPKLTYALRGWAFDDALLSNGSTVLVIAANMAKVVEDATSELLAWAKAPLADDGEREHLIRYYWRVMGVAITDATDQVVSQLVLGTRGLSLHQLTSVLLEAWHSTKAFSPDLVQQLKNELIKRSELVEIEEVGSPNTGTQGRGFSCVGGYETVKSFIREKLVRVLSEQERAKLFGVPLPKGVLFFGPPGTGKTLFAKALAHEMRLPFIRLRTEKLYGKWLGESGRRFGEVIRLVEQMSPAIVFIDEIDRFGKRRSEASDGASEETRRVFSQVLEWLGDERKSIIIGTTNAPEHLDDAFLREGRFDYKIPFLFPPLEARVEILRIHLGLTGAKPRPPWGLPDDEIEAVVAEVAKLTEQYSGAELEQVCLRARRNGFNSGRNQLLREDLLQALTTFRINREKRHDDQERYLALCEEYTNDAAFLEQLRTDS